MWACGAVEIGLICYLAGWCKMPLNQALVFIDLAFLEYVICMCHLGCLCCLSTVHRLHSRHRFYGHVVKTRIITVCSGHFAKNIETNSMEQICIVDCSSDLPITE